MRKYIDANKLCLDLLDISDESTRSLFIAYVKDQPAAEVIEVSQIEHEAELLHSDADVLKRLFRKIWIMVKSQIRQW